MNVLTILLISTNLFVSPPAENGVRNIRIEFPAWPRVVMGNAAEDVVREEYVVELPQSYTFYAAGSFIGLDRGDIGEFDVRIACEPGPIFYERSLHKETAAPFDAEDWKYTAWPRCNKLKIGLIARTTGPNEILRPGQPWSSRPHFGVRLWTWPDPVEPEPEPEPEPQPEPITGRPEDYVSLSLANGIVNQVEVDSRTSIYLGIWTSVRNLQNCAAQCTNEIIEPVLGITREELFAAARRGESYIDDWERRYRPNLTTENWRAATDPRFEGKSNLKKTNWETFKALVTAHNALILNLNNRAYADPLAQCSFDNVQGWCACRNNRENEP